MASYKESVLGAWKQVNSVTASLDMTGAASAFRRAVSTTDFYSLVPAWEFDDFKVYVLETLEGNMVWVDMARDMVVVGKHLWTVLQSDYEVVEAFVEDMRNGADGVKVINTDAGPYRAAGVAWREMRDDGASTPDPLDEIEMRIEALLIRAAALRELPERQSEQYQQVYNELTTISEAIEVGETRIRRLKESYKVAQAAVVTL